MNRLRHASRSPSCIAAAISGDGFIVTICWVLSATRTPASSMISRCTIVVRLPERSADAVAKSRSPAGRAMRLMLMSACRNGPRSTACDDAMSQNTPSTPKST